MPEDKIKKIKDIIIAVFFVFLMVAIVYLNLNFWGPIKKYVDSYASALFPTRTFTVSAEGKVTVSPDIAKLSFSAVSEGKDPKTLAEENTKQMNAGIDFVKSKGIDEKDIKTTQYNLSPRYEYDEKTKKTFISGYTLTQTVLVKIRDLTKVTDIVGGLPPVGINQIGSISFDVDEPEKYLADARSQAFDKAKAKAIEMATKNNVQLGQIISFYEYQGQPIAPIAYESAKGMGGAVGTVAPQIQPGSQEVTVQVSVTYELK